MEAFKKHMAIKYPRAAANSMCWEDQERGWQAAMKKVLLWIQSGDCYPEDVDFLIEKELEGRAEEEKLISYHGEVPE